MKESIKISITSGLSLAGKYGIIWAMYTFWLQPKFNLPYLSLWEVFGITFFIFLILGSFNSLYLSSIVKKLYHEDTNEQ